VHREGLSARSFRSQRPWGERLPHPSHLPAVAVEDHYVPAAAVVGVVALAAPPGPRPEVVEVGPGGRGHVVVLVVVLMVAQRRLGAVLVPAPGRVVAVAEVRGAASRVDVVAEGVDRPRYVAEQPRRGAVVALGAGGDVAGATRVAVAVCAEPGTAVSAAATQATSTPKATEADSETFFLIPHTFL
jgi:hypothetical protein